MANICTFALVCPTSAKWHTVPVLPSVHQMPASAPISPQQTCPQPLPPRGSKFVACPCFDHIMIWGGSTTKMHDGAAEVDFFLQDLSIPGFVQCCLAIISNGLHEW